MDAILASPLGLPNTLVLNEVIRRWEPDALEFIGMQLLPVKDYFSPQIRWDALSAVTGLTHAHALNTDPAFVQFKKLDNYSMNTAYWKEAMRFTEADLLNIRMAGSLDQTAGEKLVLEGMQMLNSRLDSRIESCIWSALLGTLAYNDQGVIRSIAYGNQTATLSDWSDLTHGTPLEDIQTAVLKFRGKAVGAPTMYINQQTANYLSQNTEIRDLVRQSMLATNVGIDNVGDLVMRLTGVLKAVVVYDKGYIDDSNTFQPFIPDGKAVIVADPPKGQRLGDFATTPSLHNGGFRTPRPGKFAFLEDHSANPNPRVDLVTGIYGLPTIKFPEAIIVGSHS